MKIKVVKVRVWTFIRRKRIASIAFLAKLFGQRSRRAGELPADNQAGDFLIRKFRSGEEEVNHKGTMSFTVKQQERKKRPLHVITMWNPASPTSIVGPVESSPRLWLKQASKKWKEHGSSRRLLDPIEDGPETSQDWRARFVDLDPDRRWPVQGW